MKFEHFKIDFLGAYVNGESNHLNRYNPTLQPRGNFRVEGHFSTGLSDSINVLIYGLFPSVLEIDSSRNVYL